MPFVKSIIRLFPVVFSVILIVAGCGAPRPSIQQSQAAAASLVVDTMTRAKWVEATLNRLTLEEKIGQMIMSRAYGYYYSRQSDEYQRLVHLVKEHKFGGLVFFQGDVMETAEIINSMQGLADVPLLIASDFEWGAAMRLKRATRFPEAMAVAATRDTLLAYRMGRAIARESRAIGIHQDYAPVADVNVNPENPVINTRSFGEDPRLVSDMAVAVAMGLEDGGLIATAKHFPGHGDTRVDSHIDLPTIGHSKTQFQNVDLVPFRALIDRGIRSVMIAHLLVPEIERTPNLPSTLSRAVTQRLLQQELGFNGLVVTDAMEMGAIVKMFGPESSAIMAVEAGNDILLLLPEEDASVVALLEAVGSGRIPESRIDHSVRKILSLKWDLGLVVHRQSDPGKIRDSVATRDHLLLAKTIARKSITVLKGSGFLPLQRLGKPNVLCLPVGDVEQYRTEIHRPSSPWPNEAMGDYFITQARRRSPGLESFRVDGPNDSLTMIAALKRAKEADVLLIPMYSKARSGSGTFGLAKPLVRFIQKLTEMKKTTILIAMGSPYVLGGFPKADVHIATYSDAELSMEAVVECLYGESAATGTLPVTIPGAYRFGDGIAVHQSVVRRDVPEAVGVERDRVKGIDSVVENAIADLAFPGAQVVVIKDGVILLERSYGRFTYDSTSPPVKRSTLFDLASLTKVIATTSSVMKLVDEGAISLEDSVTKFLPEFGNRGKEGIRIRQLLLHTAGLPAFKRLFLSVKSPQESLDSVFNTELIYPPGDSMVYSDFGFIVLGKLIERVSGRSLAEYSDSVFFRPLGMTKTKFAPSGSMREQIAPTEYDSVWRKQLIQGIVHDENADALGRVSGHAGLFSTASDLAIIMYMLNNGGSYAGKQYLAPETVALFTRRHGVKNTRALGWDTKTVNGYSSAGSFFSESSFGHTGFTGTSIWTDPTKNLTVIFLTNRVHPTRSNSKITRVRPAIHDAVIRALAPDAMVSEGATSGRK